MVEQKKLKYWEVVLKETYLSLMGSPEAAKLMREYGKQSKLEKLEKKLAKSRPEDKDKIRREILFVKAKFWWSRKGLKEQWILEKRAKQLGIKLDDYMIGEYTKTIKSQGTG